MFSLRDCITRCQRDLTPDTSDLMALHVLPSGVFGKECSTFIEILNDFGFQKQHQNCCIRRMTTIAIRTTYYIFCCRNKEWMNPELLTV